MILIYAAALNSIRLSPGRTFPAATILRISTDTNTSFRRPLFIGRASGFAGSLLILGKLRSALTFFGDRIQLLVFITFDYSNTLAIDFSEATSADAFILD